MADIRVHVHTVDGRTESIEAPAGISTEQFLRDLAGALRLPHTKWDIFDKTANVELDRKKSLEANGVHAGDHLYLSEEHIPPPPLPKAAEPAPPPLKQEVTRCPKCGHENTPTSRFCANCGASLTPTPADVNLHIHTPDGETHSLEVSVDLDVGELMIDLAKAGIIPKIDQQGRPARWELFDKDAGLRLRPGTSLKESGIRPGHHLYLTEEHIAAAPPKPVEPAPAPPKPVEPRPAAPLPPPGRKWVTPVVVAALLLAVIIALIVHFWPKPKPIHHHPPPPPPPHHPFPGPVPKGRHADALQLLRQVQRLEPRKATADTDWSDC